MLNQFISQSNPVHFFIFAKCFHKMLVMHFNLLIINKLAILSVETWSIKLKTGDKKFESTFKVAEYVLPKFEVNIEAPSAVLRNDRVVTWRICGKYTHGGSVKGVVKSNFTSSHSFSNWNHAQVTSLFSSVRN